MNFKSRPKTHYNVNGVDLWSPSPILTSLHCYVIVKKNCCSIGCNYDSIALSRCMTTHLELEVVGKDGLLYPVVEEQKIELRQERL